jgi:hypothetical protein
LFVAAFARRLQIGHLNVIFITIATIATAAAIVTIATIATAATIASTIFIFFTVANVVGIIPPPVPNPFRRIFVFYLFFEKARTPGNSATTDYRDCLRVIIMRFYDGVIERLNE